MLSNRTELLGLRKVCGWPDVYYKQVDDLLSRTDARIMIEVGVAYGMHYDHLLRKFDSLFYIGIDPYLAGYDESDGFVNDVHSAYAKSSPASSMDQLFNDVSGHAMEDYPLRSKIFRGVSVDAANHLKDNSVDFIFVDGDHTRAAVFQDLNVLYPKLRPGGIIAGDDIKWESVQQGVSDFCQLHNLVPQVENGSNGYPIYYFIK